MSITIIKDIDLITEVEKYDVILVGTNIYNLLSHGLQGEIAKKYNHVNELNLSTKYADMNKLGKRVTTKEGTPIFSLCFIVKGYNFRPDIEKEYLNYEALENCIKTANLEFQGLRVATSLMGCSQFDGKGDRERVLKLLETFGDKMGLYIYDYQQELRTKKSKQYVKRKNVLRLLKK